jgi:hypothetical protein
LSDVRDLLREVSRILECVRDGLGDGGGDLDAPVGLVVGDLEAEGLEHLALQFLGCAPQGVAQVGQPREQRGGVLGGRRIGRGRGERPELDFGGFLGSAELLDALGDELWLDYVFERSICLPIR